MKIDRICYEQLYPTGVYANQRYRVEMSLEEGVDYGATPDAYIPMQDASYNAFKYAKEQVEKTFIALNPHINWDDQSTATKSYIPKDFSIEERPIRNTADHIIEDIQSCKDIKTLESYKLIAKSNPIIQEAFNNKLKSFQ